MILDNLLHNRETDSAAARRGISRGVRAVEPVKHIRQIPRRDPPAVVLQLHLNKIPDVLDPDIDQSPLFIQIFDRIANNIINYPPQLFRVRDNLHRLIHIIKISQPDILFLKIQTDFLDTIAKIVCDIQPREVIRNAVRIDLGVERELINQRVHLIRLAVNRPDVALMLFRRISHAVYQPFRVTFERSNRRLEIMGDIADQRPILLLYRHCLLDIILQALAHLLKAFTQLPDLVAALRLDRKVQIALFNI